HIAVDLGGRESQVCVRAIDGAIVEERRGTTVLLGAYLARRPPSRGVMETWSESVAVGAGGMRDGEGGGIVAATLVRSLGVGARRAKTDRRDAQVLSEVSTRVDLAGVHLPSLAAREAKSVCGGRDVLVRSRVAFVNCVRGWLRGQLQPRLR